MFSDMRFLFNRVRVSYKRFTTFHAKVLLDRLNFVVISVTSKKVDVGK
jgi:hypothetical protein